MSARRLPQVCRSPTLFTIANDLGQMQVNANIDEADIGNISDQADVRFTVDAYPNDVFRGQISEIRLNPQTVQNVVTYSVIISIDNPDIKLKPGMTANITITVDQRENVLKIPNAALRYTPPGVQREQLRRESCADGNAAGEGFFGVREGREVGAPPLAPGQKWNPATKIKMVAPKRGSASGCCLRLKRATEAGAPQRHAGHYGRLGDGSYLGEVKLGDLLIIGDSSQTAQTARTRAAATILPGLGGRGGGGGGRGRGN